MRRSDRKEHSRHSAASSPPVADLRRWWVVFLGVLSVACGEASPHGLDDLEAKPGVETLEILPENPSLLPGESVRFELRQSSGGPVDGPVKWSATGGTISTTGRYTAGNTPGLYAVAAKHRSWTSSQTVTIESSSSPPPPDSAEPEPEVPQSDSTDSKTDPSSGTTLLQDDFERGDFLVWSGSALAGDPYWDGSGNGGAHIGDGYITNERVHSGKRAWKAIVDPTEESFGKSGKSSLENWRATRDVSDFYISAWYYIPSDYPAVSSLLMQIKAGGSGSSHKPVSVRIGRDRELNLRNGILDKTIYETGVRAPMGRWFNLVGRFAISDNGLVEVWLDGQRIASVRTDTKDNDFAYPGVGNYVDSSDYPVTCHIYIDDVKVTK